MLEDEPSLADCRARLTELEIQIERAEANENVMEREAAINALSEEHWLLEALLADLQASSPPNTPGQAESCANA